MARAWTRDELIVAMNLYSRLAFGQLHARNPLIIEAADGMDRSPNSLAMKLCNLASFDSAVTNRNRVGLKGASQLDRVAGTRTNLAATYYLHSLAGWFDDRHRSPSDALAKSR
jgi:hypothetical protein